MFRFSRSMLSFRNSVWVACLPVVLSLAFARGSAAQEKQKSAQELAREVLQNELRCEQQDNTKWEFKKIDIKGGQTKTYEVVETSRGEVKRLIELNGKPLTKAQQKQQFQQISQMVHSSDAQQKEMSSEKSDSDREQRLLKMLPKALLFEYDGREGDMVRMKFRPNPKFQTQSREQEVFHHMAGEIVLDTKNQRLSELDGRLISNVEFWHGILGHLNKGGTFHVKQGEVAPGHWDVTQLETNITGKALFFKSISVQETVYESHYRRVPDNITVAQAAEMLKKNLAESAEVK